MYPALVSQLERDAHAFDPTTGDPMANAEHAIQCVNALRIEADKAIEYLRDTNATMDRWLKHAERSLDIAKAAEMCVPEMVP